MPYYYLDTTKEEDLHRLPNIEVFGPEPWGECPACEASLLVETWESGGCPYCGLAPEDHEDRRLRHLQNVTEGYGFAFGSPGCLWDSDPCGPFETAREALAEAIDQAGIEGEENA